MWQMGKLCVSCHHLWWYGLYVVDLNHEVPDSRTAFPTCNGDEMAIRLSKNDTIDNNFTAGGYPGMGGRNIADDGHAATIVLTATPLP